jgi:ABC-type nitrate/sulfonate/bicarbonate transport system permease component
LLAIWQLLSILKVLPLYKIPSPIDVARAIEGLALVGLPQGYTLLFHALKSIYRVALGFFLASLIGIPLGILMGWSRPLREMLTPVIEMVRPIPPLAWIPIAILWFGIGVRSAAFIIFLGAFFPILLSTTAGVVSVDRILLEASRTLGAKGKDIFFKVLVPGATPSIFTGLRIGLGIGWMTLVAAEFTGVRGGFGLGYMIMVARDIQRPDQIVAGMVVIGLIGYLLDVGLRMVEGRLLRWR